MIHVWKEHKVLIWGKTYPELRKKYRETVCTGGTLEDGRFIRLYPIPLRYLADDKMFSKYQWVRVRLTKAKDDPRPESYKVHIEVVGSKGEYFASTQPSILNDDKLPAAVDRITLDSAFVHKSIFKNDPRNNVRIVLDFRKPPLFDFVSNPSMSTRNDSFIQVTGQSDTWVSGVYESIVSTLKDHSTRRSWLHRQSIYDLFLWLFVLPLAFWNLNKLLLAYPTLTVNVSSVLLVFGHIYFFVIVLFLFRAFFNYGRWLFAYVELDTPLQSVSAKQRVFFVTLSIGIIGTLLRDFALSLFKLLF